MWSDFELLFTCIIKAHTLDIIWPCILIIPSKSHVILFILADRNSRKQYLFSLWCPQAKKHVLVLLHRVISAWEHSNNLTVWSRLRKQKLRCAYVGYITESNNQNKNKVITELVMLDVLWSHSTKIITWTNQKHFLN